MYFSLPYVGKFSDQVKNKINNLVKKFCKENTNIKLIFTSCKVGKHFSCKDNISFDLRSMIVYKFSCLGCSSTYIGETSRHLCTRIDEHIKTDKNSHVYKHLHSNENCFLSFKKECFSILDSANSIFDLKIKEALHINWEKPDLNAQIKHFSLSLLL